MSSTPALLNAQADEQAAHYPYASVHSADPGTTGASEASGGSPAYTREALTWTAGGDEGPLGPTLQPATDGISWSNQVTVDLPAGTWTHTGFWDAVTSGVFQRGDAFATSVVFGSQNQILLSFGVGPAAV